MNGFYDSIDKVDFTSILTEETISEETKFCKNCFNEFVGEGEYCESCSKQLNEEIPDDIKLTLEVVSEFEDQLPLYGCSDPTELTAEDQDNLLTEVLNYVYGEGNWTNKEFNDAARELGIMAVIRESVEEDISDLQSALSELKQGIEGLNKTDDVSDEDTFEFRGERYTREKAQKEIDKIEKDLANLNQDKVDDLDNAFSDADFEEPVTEPVEEPTVPEPVEVTDGVIDPTNGDAGEASGTDVIDGIDPLSDTELSTDEGQAEDKKDEDSDETLTEAVYVDDEAHDLDSESIGAIHDEVAKDYPNLTFDVKDGVAGFQSFIIKGPREEIEGYLREIYGDGEELEVELSKITESAKLKEAAVNPTIANIDQESKDKATVDRAIALAGDKNTIDNDTFRALRLALANKDYDMIDRLKDYALVRGEDVIYTWLRAEDSDLKESVRSNKLFLKEGVDCKALNEEESSLDVNEDLQVSDVPAKEDQGKPGKRLELAKLENEGITTYRVSYLKEDDEVMGWDIDADSDEEALDALDKFDASSDTIDDVSNLEFTDTPIDGISSANYNGVDLALSTAEDGNALLTITTQEGVPVLLKGENLNDILTKLIYWFIMGIEDSSKEVM